jgi:hypothetical protein
VLQSFLSRFRLFLGFNPMKFILTPRISLFELHAIGIQYRLSKVKLNIKGKSGWRVRPPGVYLKVTNQTEKWK